MLKARVVATGKTVVGAEAARLCADGLAKSEAVREKTVREVGRETADLSRIKS